MKNIELKLISELMKNSRRSDRELAQAIGVSQPTVSRTIKKLEKEEYIQEYTAIPNFAKLGYELAALTFARLEGFDMKKMGELRKSAQEYLEKGALEVVMLARGIGTGQNIVIVSLHKDYTSYNEFRNWLNQFPFPNIHVSESFLISLKDEIQYRPLTFSTLAKHLLTLKEITRTE